MQNLTLITYVVFKKISTFNQSSGAVWESRWPSWAVRPNEPSGFRGRKELLNRASALVTTCPEYINWHLRTLSITSPPSTFKFTIYPTLNQPDWLLHILTLLLFSWIKKFSVAVGLHKIEVSSSVALALDSSGVSASFGAVVPDGPKVHVQSSLDVSLTFELYRYRASKWSSLRSVVFLPLKPVLNWANVCSRT